MRPIVLLLRWKMELESWWKPQYWTRLAVSLWPVAFFLPPYLQKIGHHPPVGTYIAVLGGMAAAVTFRKDPPTREKSAWIILVALVMVAEIRNLYVADHEQSETFSSVNDGLKSTKRGLDSATATLSGISGDITKASDENQKQFDAASRKSAEILDKTKLVADTASEAVANLTGGDTVPEITVVSNVSNGENPPKFPLLLWVRGKHPLRNASISYQDHNETQRANGPMTLEQVKALSHYVPLEEGGTGTVFPGLRILSTYIPAGSYTFTMATGAGTFSEEMTITITSPAKLNEEYTVRKDGKIIIQFDGNRYTVKPLGE